MKLDLLHLVDLGVASHVYGNLLAALVNNMGMGRVKALVELNKMIATEYQHLGIQSGNRLPRLNVSDIFTDDFPCLRHVKGRRIRKFAPVATKLAASLTTNAKGKHIHALCKCMEETYDFCDRKQFVWSAEAGQKFADKCEALLAHYSWLAKDSMKQGNCMFSIVQKHHLFAHYPSQCRYLAPRGCWAYGGESFMSLMVAIASGSVKSTPAWMLPSKVLNKFQFAFHLVLKGIWDPGMEEEGEDREWKKLCVTGGWKAMGFGWVTIFTQLCFAQLWVNGGWKAMSFGWWLDSRNFCTIVFCTALGMVAGKPLALFGWMVAGHPQFLHNCVLHSMGEWWLESHELAGQPQFLQPWEWWLESHGLWVDGGWTATIFTQLCFAQHGWMVAGKPWALGGWCGWKVAGQPVGWTARAST